MRTLADVDDQLTAWAYKPAPRAGTFMGGSFNGLSPGDVFDALSPSDVFDGLSPNDVFSIGPDDLCALYELSDAELMMLSEFDGFWSSVTSGIKKVAKVVKEKGAPVLKYGIPGVKDLGDGLKKVGRFVVKQPLLQKALETAIPVIGPLITGPMLEVAASMVEQQGKKMLIAAGVAPTVANLVARTDAKKPAKTESSPKKAVLPAPATVGFSSLPAAGIKKLDFAAALAAMQKLPPVAQKVAQRFVRAGIPAPMAIDVVTSVDFGRSKAAPMNAAYIGSLKLQQQHARNPR